MPTNEHSSESLATRLREALASTQGRSDQSRILALRAARIRKAEHTDADTGAEFVVFVRDQTRYAVAITDLTEIRLANQISPIPGISKAIKGVTNIRGRVIVVHDLASWLKGSVDSGARPWLLVGCGRSANLALLADDVEGIRAIPETALACAPLSLAERRTSMRGVFEGDILVLNLDGLIEDRRFYCA